MPALTRGPLLAAALGRSGGSGGIRALLGHEIMPAVTVGKLTILVAALISLYLDQSFGGAYTTLASYVGGSLHATPDELSWTSAGYNACYDTTILLTPWLVKRFGRRVVFSSTHLSFFAITAVLAAAPPLGAFVIFRAIQGIAQGTFFVCSVITVLTLFPAQYRGYAFSIFSVTSLAGAASGSFVGGWFADHADWNGAFMLYACLALVAGAVIGLLLEANGPDPAMRLDAAGLALGFGVFFGYQCLAAFGERHDWFNDPRNVVYAALALGSFAGFIVRELIVKNPVTPLRLYRIHNLAFASVLGFGLGAPLFGANAFLQYAQQVLGFPPSTAGALLLLRIISIAIVAPVAVLLVNADKIDIKIPVVVGFALVAYSYESLSWQTTSDSAFGTFLVALVISGAGFACLFSPIANVTVRSLPLDYASEGIALFKIVLVLGGSAAAATLNVLYDHDFAAFHTMLAGSATLAHLSQIGSTIAPANLARLISFEASALAYAKNSQWVTIISLAVLPFAFFLKKPSAPGAPAKSGEPARAAESQAAPGSIAAAPRPTG